MDGSLGIFLWMDVKTKSTGVVVADGGAVGDISVVFLLR